jgi:hypothetical protein
VTEVLKSTVNIPPTVRKQNGDRIQILVARDLDFRSVYELQDALPMLVNHRRRVGALVARNLPRLELMLASAPPWLSDSSAITELCINRPREASAETREGWRAKPLPFADFDWCRRLAKLIANFTGSASTRSPLLSASLPRGERVQIVMPPATTGLCCDHDPPAVRTSLVDRGAQPQRHLQIHARATEASMPPRPSS